MKQISPRCAHTQHLHVSQTSQGVQEKVCTAISEKILGIALLVVKWSEQHTGPSQLSRGDECNSMSRVSAVLSRQEQDLTILTKLLLIRGEGGEPPKPEGHFIFTEASKESVTVPAFCI